VTSPCSVGDESVKFSGGDYEFSGGDYAANVVLTSSSGESQPSMVCMPDDHNCLVWRHLKTMGSSSLIFYVQETFYSSGDLLSPVAHFSLLFSSRM